MSWRCIHIFYYDNHDFIIRAGLTPILSRNNIENFFFIRYWENGPHIRLRIKDIDDQLFEKIKYDICNFIKTNPSKLIINKDKYIKRASEYGKKEKNFTNNKGIISNNTVKDWVYEPEFKKYHGIQGVPIAEKEFIYSSKLAMKILISEPSVSKKYMFGATFALLVLKNICSNSCEMGEFLSEYIKYWKNFSGVSDRSFLSIEESVKNYSVLPKSVEAIVEFYKNHSFDLLHKDIFDELRSLKGSPTTSFCFNFIHLFNNRIGMSPAEEIVISFIGKKILGE